MRRFLLLIRVGLGYTGIISVVGSVVIPVVRHPLTSNSYMAAVKGAVAAFVVVGVLDFLLVVVAAMIPALRGCVPTLKEVEGESVVITSRLVGMML